MPTIFLNYRRDDSKHSTGRIDDHLEARFGRAYVFRDIDRIRPGRDFRVVLDTEVSRCDVLLAVIGEAWLHAVDETGRRRLDNPADFVRIELESALKRGIPVIPVLVGTARMPRPEDLPENLRDLAYRHAVTIRDDPDFRSDIQRLIRCLEELDASNDLPPEDTTWRGGRSGGERSNLVGRRSDAGLADATAASIPSEEQGKPAAPSSELRDSDSKPYFGFSEAADYLQLPVATLNRLRTTGVIQAAFHEGAWRFARRDLDEFVRRSTAAAHAPSELTKPQPPPAQIRSPSRPDSNRVTDDDDDDDSSSPSRILSGGKQDDSATVLPRVRPTIVDPDDSVVGLPTGGAAPPPLTAPFAPSVARKTQEKWAAHLAATTFPQAKVEIRTRFGMRFTLVPPGEYRMGSPDSDDHALRHECPRHQVRINQPFYIGTVVVTQADWRAVVGSEVWKGKPYVFMEDEAPATCVDWNDAREFCRILSERMKRVVRLPTEAEWEYACRSGSETRYCFGDDVKRLPEFAWFNSKAPDIGTMTAQPVARKKPNAFGLFDMHGNVWEWCEDAYDASAYEALAARVSFDPCMRDGEKRVYRGGTWGMDEKRCRSADRGGFPPLTKNAAIGFRVVLEV